MTNENFYAFIDWLEDQHREVMAREAEAMKALDISDKAAYEEGMREKAKLLKNIYVLAMPRLKDCPEDKKEKVQEVLQDFSRNAATALSLDSPFYMSALLYPDDHKKGEPDNFQKFINALKK